MDITDQILAHHRIYGASDYTNPAYNSSARQLNYANGASIVKPDVTKIGAIPFTLKFQDSVGLFGTENYFIRVDLKVEGAVLSCFEEPFWFCARLSEEVTDPTDPYTYSNTGTTPGAAYIEQPADENDPAYEAAVITQSEVPEIARPRVKINLKNLKTGNIYLDSWLDVRLYTQDREEHPYDVMYCGRRDSFYIGFHARNTKRLPYNVECIIGEEYLTDSEIEERYIMKKLIN